MPQTPLSWETKVLSHPLRDRRPSWAIGTLLAIPKDPRILGFHFGSNQPNFYKIAPGRRNHFLQILV